MASDPSQPIIVNGKPSFLIDANGIAVPLNPESSNKRDSRRTPSPLEEIIQEMERIKQREMRSLQASNPDYHAYITKKMCGADREKLEERAAIAGMSVKDYTALSPLDRYKAEQSKRRQ